MIKTLHKRSKSEDRGSYLQFPKGLNNLAGEYLRLKQHVNYICPYSEKRNGILYLTNYRLYFHSIGNDIQHFETSLGTIFKIKRLHNDHNSSFMDITCKNIRKLRFEIDNTSSSKLFIETLSTVAFPISFGLKTFAFNYSEVFKQDGWKVYDPIAEFERMGIKPSDGNSKWRITVANRNYNLCPTYPSILAVPGLKDNELEVIASFRSKSRLPVLSWINPKNFSTITRCSQPLCGVKGSRSSEDERYINVIRCTHSFQHKLTIADCRPLANAVMNKAKGGGYETANAYSGIEIIFLNIPNIHVMRESLGKLKSVCLNPPIQDKFFSSLNNTLWLKHIKNVLVGAVEVVNRIKDENSVVVHCSDGWDRTSQITSLAMFMLDPYYRTIKGFEVLIEKEWLSFGHKFQQRYGHGDITYKDEERSPIFVQFIDCVWQIQQQFPSSMEFNEKFLLRILDHLYSCRFGTFMCNTERERKIEVRHQTISLWSWINSSLELYRNKSYKPLLHDVIIPAVSSQSITLWKNYYCKWNPSMFNEKPIKHNEPPQNQIMKGIEKLDVSTALKSMLMNPFESNSNASTSRSKFYQ